MTVGMEVDLVREGGGRAGKSRSETGETNSLLEGTVFPVMSEVDTIGLPSEIRNKCEDLRSQAQVILERSYTEPLFQSLCFGAGMRALGH